MGVDQNGERRTISTQPQDAGVARDEQDPEVMVTGEYFYHQKRRAAEPAAWDETIRERPIAEWGEFREYHFPTAGFALLIQTDLPITDDWWTFPHILDWPRSHLKWSRRPLRPRRCRVIVHGRRWPLCADTHTRSGERLRPGSDCCQTKYFISSVLKTSTSFRQVAQQQLR